MLWHNVVIVCLCKYEPECSHFELQIYVNKPQRKWTITSMGGTHILCLHSGLKGRVTVWREFLATVRCSIEALRTQNLCVGKEWGRDKKGTEGKENPSEIERHVTQQRKRVRFIHIKGVGHQVGEKER